MNGRDRWRVCLECDRTVPANAVEPVKRGNKTKFVCGECANDLRYRDTDDGLRTDGGVKENDNDREPEWSEFSLGDEHFRYYKWRPRDDV